MQHMIPRHIRLTSHPGGTGQGGIPLRWGAPDAETARPRRGQPGPAAASQCDRLLQRLLRRLSRARGRDPGAGPGSPARPDRHRAGRGDRTLAAMGRPEEDRVARPVRASGRRGVRRADPRRHRCPADDRGDRGAYQPAGNPPAHRVRRHRPGRQRRAGERRDPRHQGRDRPGLVPARHRRAVRRRRIRIAPAAVRGDRRACSRSW